MSDIESTRSEALAALEAVADAAALEAWRLEFLGKKGRVKALMKRLKDIPGDQKRAFGQGVNALEEELAAAFEGQKGRFGAAPKAAKKTLDITLPGRPPRIGTFHPITRIRDEMVEVMQSLGFEVVEGPEVEDEFHNFNALNIPPNHPARDESDNFYLEDGHLLRSQTSTVQIRVMEKKVAEAKSRAEAASEDDRERAGSLSFRVIAPGRVYRPDTVDASHHYMFHQIEGLAVDRNLTMKDLKVVLLQFFKGLFGTDVTIRLRPNFFPFTEPSAEVDVACTFCEGKGCATCSQKGWIEMGGCGMVDPNVFLAVGIDPEEYTGFAFGLGIERLAMRRFGIPDIRLLTENDIRFLKQFA
ncbi:MAG: phenylalanine--tRNA ligase subunit alpha [Planctomycetota bacterium]